MGKCRYSIGDVWFFSTARPAFGKLHTGQETQIRADPHTKNSQGGSIGQRIHASMNDAPNHKPHIEIHTDGACSGNPGPGGWGALLRYGSTEKELSGGEPLTTNNRMELLAAICALESLSKPCKVDLYTDSQYVQKGISIRTFIFGNFSILIKHRIDISLSIEIVFKLRTFFQYNCMFIVLSNSVCR